MSGTLNAIRSRWLLLCGKLGDLAMAGVLTVFYFVLFLIPSLYYTWWADTLGKRWRDGSYFEDLPESGDTPGDAGEMA
jgi:hypothetical protein